ncbi:DpnD protein [Weissella confusa]|uniref:DpnD/PcfM family protein n=1 Tax=Weissella confusa TaxID=1583 RepID=UPI00223B5183|nr:DpnD/PcfM family protein [Weissella confusa]MCS9997173.1 DpnD protein [Weissella confusa]
MKYQVEIIETLARTIEVEAEDKSAAELIAHNMYRNEEVVLDEGDYMGVQITTLD